MATLVKAGIPHPFSVETNSDMMGFASSFKVKHTNIATGVSTVVNETFSEIMDTVAVLSVTVTVDAVIGDQSVTVDNATGLTAGSSVRINGKYYRVMAISGNLITFKYKLLSPIATNDTVELVGNTGTYVVNLTFVDTGFYTVFMTNPELGMDNTPIAIEVMNATIDDVSGSLSALQGDVTSIKTQIDLLDETTVNGISGQVDQLALSLNGVHALINDTSDVSLSFAGDLTGQIDVGDNVTGETSGATGVVQYVTYDTSVDATSVVLNSIIGVFTNGENIVDDAGIIIAAITALANNVTNSVLEFVNDIKTLLSSDGGLDGLRAINADIEHLIKGTPVLEDGSVNPTAGKGLTMIYDELVTNSTDTAAARAQLEDATNGLVAIRTAVSTAQVSVEAKIAEMNDLGNPDSMLSKIVAARTVIDANQSLLADSTNGLAAIKAELDSTYALFETGGAVELRFSSIDTTLGNLNTTLVDGISLIDGKLDSILQEISELKQSTSYTVIA